MRNSIISLLFILISYSCTDKTTIPIDVTAPISDIRSTSALCGGTVATDGGGEILNQGICWSINKNPTTSDNYVYDSIGLSSYSITITGLSSNTSYYIRSFATNSSGTGYGSMVKLTTMGKNVVVLDGDSRTDGWNCEYRYPYIDLLKLKEPSILYKTSVGGLSSEDLILRGPAEVDTKFSFPARVNVVVVWVGVNDIAINDRSAEFTFTNLVTYCTERRTKGWKVIVCTEVSMKGQGSNGECDLTREIYNDLIKNHWQEFADGTADLAANPEIGAVGAYLDTTYFCDGIHLTNSGTEIVAGLVNQTIDKLMNQ
jgi:lysophospholipase L1-like esterase